MGRVEEADPVSLHRYQTGYIDLSDDPAASAEHVLQCAEPAEAVTVRLPGELRSRIDEAAARDGVSPDTWLEKAIASSLSSSSAAAA
jgi:hypothetical protein